MAKLNSDEESENQCSKSDETCSEENLQGRLKYLMFTYDSIKDKWNQYATDMSKDEILNSINRIYQYSVKSDDIERKAFLIEEKLKKSNSNVENDIEQLKQDIEALQTKFEQIKIDPQLENESNKGDNDEEEIFVFLDPSAPKQVHHKVQFSNDIVRYLKGPFKLLVKGVMGAADLAAKGTSIDESFLQAVKKGLEKQKGKQKDDSLRPTFTEINAHWKVEGENKDQGFNSPSIWIKDPQGRRILIKIQPLPICVANEWLAYAIGRYLGLPVNEVQIALYENQLVTLHTDDQNENEKTMTFMDLPKEKGDILLTNPIIEHMDIFDHLIQNVDRNQQNILLILPKTVEIDKEKDDQDISQVPLKVRLIDHASSFGMGKMSGVSEIAAKFHSDRFSVVKFDPVQKSKEFEDYLSNFPAEDRSIISEILSRFASVTDEQFDEWINEIQDFLSSSQNSRITNVLRRQRDIARRYVNQWNASP